MKEINNIIKTTNVKKKKKKKIYLKFFNNKF